MIIDAEMLRRLPPEPVGSGYRYRAAAVVGDIELELHSDAYDLIRCFAGYYRDQRGSAQRRVPFAVRETVDGYRFSSPLGSFVWAHGPLPVDALMFLVDAAAISSLLESDPAIESFHAAAIEHGGRAAAIAGASNQGKTTTLLACARAGCRLYTDERVILRDRTLRPFLRTCSTRGAGRAMLLEDCGTDRLAAHLHRDERLSLVGAFGEDAIAPSLPLSFVFLISGYAQAPLVTPRSAFDALPIVAPWYRATGSNGRRLASALDFLRSVRIFELLLGTPQASARAIQACMGAS